MRAVTFCAVAMMAGPAMAQVWEATVNVGPDVTIAGTYQGTFYEYAPERLAARYGQMQGFLGPDVPRGTRCDGADWYELDFAFGETGLVAVQLLFGLERMGEDRWRVDIPAAFLNIETAEDFAAVLLERYEGADVILNELVCEPDGQLTVDINYEFSGPPDTEKGPEFLTVSGRVKATMPLLPYDQY